MSTLRRLDEPWASLRDAYLALRGRRSELLRGFDLSLSEYVSLRLCVQAPAMASAIADKVGVTSAGATDIIDRLEERGLARRLSHPKDRRAVLVTLTPAGRRLYLRAETAQRAMLRELSNGLSPAERDALVVGLRAVADLLRASPSPARSGPRV